MLSTVRTLAIVSAICLLLAPLGIAQNTGAFVGTVTGTDGNPVEGAVIKIERTDIAGSYEAKTNERGRYQHFGLPLGMYNLICEVNGAVAGREDGRRAQLGEQVTVDFDLGRTEQARQAMEKAIATGTISEELMQTLSPEQQRMIREEIDRRAEEIKSGQNLNAVFNAAMEAKKARQWDVAVENFTKATALADEQNAKPETKATIWSNLASTHFEKAKTLQGDAQKAAAAEALPAYDKVSELDPADADNFNNKALALYMAGRSDEGYAALQKAIEMNPTGAAMYYYNLGASLININMTANQDAACESFAKAVELDPNHVDSQFQHGNCLMYKMTMADDGSMVAVPGTKEAFQKVIELQPGGELAAQAQGILQALESTVEKEIRK